MLFLTQQFKPPNEGQRDDSRVQTPNLTRSVYILMMTLQSIHYDDVIMGAIITSLTIVYSTVYSDEDKRKHQSFASLTFVWGPANSPHTWPVTRKMFPFDNVMMWPIYILRPDNLTWVRDKLYRTRFISILFLVLLGSVTLGDVWSCKIYDIIQAYFIYLRSITYYHFGHAMLIRKYMENLHFLPKADYIDRIQRWYI